jgi:hypothetical protein
MENKLMPVDINSIDWTADGWFTVHHAADLSKEFKHWWLIFYGPPADYSITQEEQHRYWVRCAFAWHGWKAGRNILRQEQS